MGGSDAAGISQTIYKALKNFAGSVRFTVVVGPAADELAIPQSASWTVLRDPRNLGDIFDTADAAIATASSTALELLCMGIPTAVVQVADNQRHVGAALQKDGTALFIGLASDVDAHILPTVTALTKPSTKRSLSSKSLSLVDGLGADRLLDSLTI